MTKCRTCGADVVALREAVTWCPSCGTAQDGDIAFAPNLVRFCRFLADEATRLGPHFKFADQWKLIGLDVVTGHPGVPHFAKEQK